MSKTPLVSGDFRKELEQQLMRSDIDINLLSDFRKELLAKKKSHFCALPFIQLSLGVVDTIFNILDAADFYAGLKRIEFCDTPAVKMESLIATLDSERGDPRNLARYSRDSEIDNHLLPLALYVLLTLLEQLCKGMKERVHGIDTGDLSGFFYQFKNASNEEIHGDESYFTINDFQISLDRISYDLKNLQTFLRLKEHDIYDQHPEWEATVPNHSKELHAYYEQYGNQLEDFEEMTNLLTCRYKFDNPTPVFSGSDLRPFLASIKSVNLDGEIVESAPWDFSTQLKQLLSTPINIEVALPDYACAQYGECTASLNLNPWIAAAKKMMYDAFTSYCRKREAELPDGITKELLKKGAVELITSRKDSITAADIVRMPSIGELVEQSVDGAQGKDTPASQKDTDAILRKIDSKIDDIAQSQKSGKEEILGAVKADTKATINLGRKVDAAKTGVKTIATGLTTLFPNLEACTKEEAEQAFGQIPRYVGLDKITNIAHRSQIKAAIDYSHTDPGFTIHPPRQNGTSKKPTITDLAKEVWKLNEKQWKLSHDSFETLDKYTSALLHHFEMYPHSLLHYTD